MKPVRVIVWGRQTVAGVAFCLTCDCADSVFAATRLGFRKIVCVSGGEDAQEPTEYPEGAEFVPLLCTMQNDEHFLSAVTAVGVGCASHLGKRERPEA